MLLAHSGKLLAASAVRLWHISYRYSTTASSNVADTPLAVVSMAARRRARGAGGQREFGAAGEGDARRFNKSSAVMAGGRGRGGSAVEQLSSAHGGVVRSAAATVDYTLTSGAARRTRLAVRGDGLPRLGTTGHIASRGDRTRRRRPRRTPRARPVGGTRVPPPGRVPRRQSDPSTRARLVPDDFSTAIRDPCPAVTT